MPVAPRIVNDLSYVRRINHERYFVVQSSTGVVLCRSELNGNRAEYRLVLCSTDMY